MNIVIYSMCTISGPGILFFLTAPWDKLIEFDVNLLYVYVTDLLCSFIKFP